MNPLHSPLLPLFLSELLFGLLYAALVHWLSVKRYMQGSTALSVVVGDGMTLFILWLFYPLEWDPFVTFLCFACSGLPMFVTYAYRHERRKSHKAKKIPPGARRVRDEIVMDLNMVAEEIEQPASAVHKLHQAIAALRDL